MRIKKGIGIAVILLTALIMGFIGFNKIRKAKTEFAAAEAALPESAISAYFGHIKNKDFDGIYEDSMVVSPHINSKADYIAKLEEIYKGVNTSDIEYTGLDNTDGSKDEVPVGLKITANGVEVGSEYLLENDTVASNFSGLRDQSQAPRVDVYELSNLLGEPVIEVAGESGYGTLTDVLTGHIFVGKTASDSSLAQTMIDDAIICAKFPAQEASLGQVGAISITASDWYNRVAGVQNQWFTSHGTSSFSNQNAFNIIQQSEDSMVGFVTFDYYASNGEVSRTWNGGYQMTFLNVGGTWKIAGMAINNEMNPNKVTPLQD